MSSRPSVLVCDDEPNLRELIRVSLGERYDFVEAADGEQALALARSLRPHLVILDLMMPRLNGLDVLSKLKADPELASMPVLVVTAKDLTDDERFRLNGGVERIILKRGYGPEELQRELGHALAACAERRRATPPA